MELRYCEKCGDVLPVQGSAVAEMGERFFCSRCAGGASAPRGDEGPDAGTEQLLATDSLNFFSPKTVRMKRQEQQEKEAQREASLPGEGGEPKDTGLPQGSPSGSAVPAPTARKLQFRCLHCRAVLLVRPVQQASRMVCPKCKGSLFIDQTGVVSKQPPASARVLQNSGPARVRP